MHTLTDVRTIRSLIDRRVVIFYLGLIAASLPTWPFGWHLAVHVVGAAMLIGNAIVMAVWLSIAGFAGDDAAKRRAALAVNVGDVWFTVPGVALLLGNGVAMVFERYGGVSAFTTTPFIAAGLVLLTLTGMVWAARLVPTQQTLLRISEAAGPLDQVAFRSALTRWSAWGVVATVLPIVAVIVMTTKPTL
jgi:uncharacterized membrane protein